jgi:CBS domain-containing protein
VIPRAGQRRHRTEDDAMNVEQLLGDKGREVISVQPHRTFGEVVRTLTERRIGAVAVMGADGALVGILS